MKLRRETSADSAARFLAMRRGRVASKLTRRAALASVSSTKETVRISIVRAVLPLDLVRSAAWIPDAPVARELTSNPIAPIAWPAMPVESNADRLRRYRAAAVALGNCYQCRCRPIKPGTRYCPACIQRAADYAESIAYRKCQTCGVALNGRKALLCLDCTKKSSESAERWAQRRVSRGMCRRCGKNRLHPGAVQCLMCLDEMRDRVLASQREIGRKPRPCPICRELGIDGTGHDRRTHDRWMERRKRWTPEAA